MQYPDLVFPTNGNSGPGSSGFVSTRRVDDIARAMGIEGISRSQVSRIAAELDAPVEEWRNRSLDQGPYPLLWLDALEAKLREGGRVVGTSALVATTVNGDRRREIVGLPVGAAETGASWTAFLTDLVALGSPSGQTLGRDCGGESP